MCDETMPYEILMARSPNALRDKVCDALKYQRHTLVLVGGPVVIESDEGEPWYCQAVALRECT